MSRIFKRLKDFDRYSSRDADRGVEQLFSHLSPEERKTLVKSWEHLARKESPDTDAVQISTVEAHFSGLTASLRKRLTSYFAAISNCNEDNANRKKTNQPNQDATRVTKLGFLKGILDLTRGSDDSKQSAVYTFLKASTDNSLSSVIADIAEAGLATYAKGFGKDGTNKTPLKHDRTDIERLVNYILLSQFSATYNGVFLDAAEEASHVAKMNSDKNEWLQKCARKPTLISPDEFRRCWTSSPELQRLLKTWSEDIFFTAAVPEPMPSAFSQSTSCDKALAAPQVTLLPSSNESSRFLLTLVDAWLVHAFVPAASRREWKLLYSSAVGKSWHQFSTSITEHGTTLILAKEAGSGRVFGGFSNTEWKPKPHFYGSQDNFLVSLTPDFNLYRATSINANYQYFNSGQATLRNGLQFGGQESYPGFWINSDFERGSTRPCTTYGTATRLSAEEDFRIGEVEAWCLLEPEVDEELEELKRNKRSAMDSNAEAVHMLESAGRRMYSKEVRDADDGAD